jgi:hypothetical protein
VLEARLEVATARALSTTNNGTCGKTTPLIGCLQVIALIGGGGVSPAVSGEKLAADRNRRVFGKNKSVSATDKKVYYYTTTPTD